LYKIIIINEELSFKIGIFFINVREIMRNSSLYRDKNEEREKGLLNKFYLNFFESFPIKKL